MLQKARNALIDTGTRARQSYADNPERWRAERDILAIGTLASFGLAWLDVHLPEGVTLALAYLIIRAVQSIRRRKE